MLNVSKLVTALAELEEDDVMEIVQEVVDEGGEFAQQAVQACQEGMSIIGSRFETGEYFVGDLIYAGEVMTRALEILKPALGAGEGTGPAAKMIICTVKGDVHDIGKNVVKAMLEAAGFDVIDLGIDVAPETIVDAIKAEEIGIVALSGVLTLAVDSMKNTVDAIADAGLRDQVKVIVGGNMISAESCATIGADEWAQSPQKTVDTCLAWSA
jgi:methylmalonyl-CoA mutase cobalamin-binding domain/chain